MKSFHDEELLLAAEIIVTQPHPSLTLGLPWYPLHLSICPDVST